ncbi:hypothetical protein B0H13DRAFT_2316936 [Mycena leptocephala]|nr:hypothetical protein B0H13DRAFT_2316936 [Mycena leptocephala]
MGSQDPPFPSFSFVLSQAHPTYSSPTPAHLVFPWTSITYHPPNIPANPNPSPAPQAPAAQGHRALSIMVAIRRFFAAIIDKLKAHR